MPENEPTPNQIPFPRITLVKGLAELAFHAVFDHIRKPGLSERFITDAVDSELPDERLRDN